MPVEVTSFGNRMELVGIRSGQTEVRQAFRDRKPGSCVQMEAETKMIQLQAKDIRSSIAVGGGGTRAKATLVSGFPP